MLLKDMFELLQNKDKQQLCEDYTLSDFESFKHFILFELKENEAMEDCCRDCPYLIEGKNKEWCCDLRDKNFDDIKCKENYLNCLESENNNV